VMFVQCGCLHAQQLAGASTLMSILCFTSE